MSCFFFLNGWISLEPAPSASSRFEAFGSVAGVSSSVCAQRKPPSCGVLKIQFEVTKFHLILPVLFQALQQCNDILMAQESSEFSRPQFLELCLQGKHF
jgi:hypothetical protein